MPGRAVRERVAADGDFLRFGETVAVRLERIRSETVSSGDWLIREPESDTCMLHGLMGASACRARLVMPLALTIAGTFTPRGALRGDTGKRRILHW